MNRPLLAVFVAASVVGCDDAILGSICVTEPLYPPSWEGVEELFRARRCDACHPSIHPPDLHEDLRLSAEQALLDLDDDGVANWEDPDRDGDGTPDVEDDDVDGDGSRNDLDLDPVVYYVVPGRPEASLLWQVLAGTAEDASLMPFGAVEPLCEGEIGHVGAWIAAGAIFEETP